MERRGSNGQKEEEIGTESVREYRHMQTRSRSFLVGWGKIRVVKEGACREGLWAGLGDGSWGQKGDKGLLHYCIL